MPYITRNNAQDQHSTNQFPAKTTAQFADNRATTATQRKQQALMASRPAVTTQLMLMGQEQHLPHDAWHLVQQAQGRVKPTMQLKAGAPENDVEVSSGSSIIQRYYDAGMYRNSDDSNYAIALSDPQKLFVKDGSNPPHPISFFNQAAANPGWKAYMPKAALYNAAIYPDYHGPNDCGMYATALAKNNPSWGRIKQTYLSLVGKESGNYPQQNFKSVHENLKGGKTDKEIEPQTGEALLIHPPEGSTSGFGGSSLFSYRCNFHAAPIVVKSSTGGDYVTSEADAGDQGRAFPHWEMYGTKKEQTFHYKNAIKYKDRLNSNPTGEEWPKTYALKAPPRYQSWNKIFTRINGVEIYSVYDTTYDCNTHLACLNHTILDNLGSVPPDRYELLGTEVTYRNGNKVMCFHDGVTNRRSYRCFNFLNMLIFDYGSVWVKPLQYESIQTKWHYPNGTRVDECHDLYNNQTTHILVNSLSNSMQSLIGPVWVKPSAQFEYISREITYFGGDQVYFAYDGLTGRKTYIKVSSTNQMLEDFGPHWNKPNQYELLEKQLDYQDGREVHYAHDRHANDQSYILINTITKSVVRDLGKGWKKSDLLHY